MLSRKSIFEPQHSIVGLKIGKAKYEESSKYISGSKTLGEHVKIQKLFLSKMKIFLVTSTNSLSSKCSCQATFPKFAMSFVCNDVTCHDKKSAVDHLALFTPDLPDDINPQNEGFLLKTLVKCHKCELDYVRWESGSDGRIYKYPMTKKQKGIIHGPDEIHGVSCGNFVGVIVGNHEKKPMVKWYLNGKLHVQGDGPYIIWPQLPGTYHAVVGREKSTAYSYSTKESPQRTSVKRPSEGAPAPPQKSTKTFSGRLIDVKDLKYDPKKDEVGEGYFAPVFKAELYGTDVAYKVCKLTKRDVAGGIKDFIETEVSIHSSLSHPNIIQFIGLVKKTHICWYCDRIHGIQSRGSYIWQRRRRNS